MKRARLSGILFAILPVAAALLVGAAPAFGFIDGARERIVLDEYPITIEYKSDDQRVADKVSEICSQTIPELAAELGLGAVRPFHVYLIPKINVRKTDMGFRLPEWGVAFAFMDDQVMLVDVAKATSAWNTLERVIPHELSHLLVAQRIGHVRMPIWFTEGLAMWQSGEWSMLETWRLMEAVWGKRAPWLGQISNVLPSEEAKARDAYRVSYAGFTHLFGENLELLPGFLGEVSKTGDFSEAFSGYWGESEHQYYERFGEHLYRKYTTRLMIFQPGPLFSIMAVLFLLVFVRIKLRNRQKLKRMEEIERGLSADDSSRW